MLHSQLKSPIPSDKNKSAKRPRKSASSPREFTPSVLPNTTPDHKVHEWVYNNEISSDISMSSQGTEMTANKVGFPNATCFQRMFQVLSVMHCVNDW